MSIFDTPHFDHLGNASQLGATNMNKLGENVAARTTRPGVGTRMTQTSSGISISAVKPKIQTRALPPFWPTLKGNGDNGLLLDMEDGYVVLRKKKTGEDAMATLLPVTIPDELTVAVGDKITCRIQEDSEGLFTTASIVVTSGDWPESLAPVLKGGDNTSGTAGDRHVRLCEIVEDEQTRKVIVWNTGHIDHFQPTLIENADTSGARVLKEFDPSAGMWILRRLIAGAGLTMTENADDIEVGLEGAEGKWAEITWDVDNNGSLSALTLSFEAGRLVGIAAAGSDASETGAGTEADPCIASIAFYDT